PHLRAEGVPGGVGHARSWYWRWPRDDWRGPWHRPHRWFGDRGDGTTARDRGHHPDRRIDSRGADRRRGAVRHRRRIDDCAQVLNSIVAGASGCSGGHLLHYDRHRAYMRTLLLPLSLTIGNASFLLAQEAEKAPPLVALRINLMFWTLLIFGLLYFMLRRWAFPAILGAVEKREQALQEALEAAKRDREEAQ